MATNGIYITGKEKYILIEVKLEQLYFFINKFIIYDAVSRILHGIKQIVSEISWWDACMQLLT